VDRLSQQLNNQQNSLFTAYKTLAGLKSQDGYDSDSMEAQDAKQMIDFWRTKRNETMERLNKDSIGVQEAAEEPRAYKPKEPNRMPKHPADVEYIDRSSSPNSPASESSANSSIFAESRVLVAKKPSKKRRTWESSSDDDN
jgi:hypothetical protein